MANDTTTRARTWTRDKTAEEGGSHRLYVADDGWIVERRYWPGNTPALEWWAARDEDSNWEGFEPTLAKIKEYVDREDP